MWIFGPNELATPKWRAEIARRTRAQKMVSAANFPKRPVGDMSRGEFAQAWWDLVRDLPDKPWASPRNNFDADADGIPDIDDAFPLDADNNGLPDGW